MRGRTNITPRTIPKVNGSVVEYIVEEGNSISTGDFVEIVYNDGYGNFIELKNKKQIVIDDEYVIVAGTNASNAGVIMLLKIQGVNFSVVNQIPLVGVSEVSKIGYDIFVTYIDIYHFTIENNQLVLKETIQVANDSQNKICCSDGNNLFVISKNKIYLYKMQNSSLVYVSTLANSENYMQELKDCEVVSDNLIITSSYLGSSNYYIKYLYDYKISYLGTDVSSLSLLKSSRKSTTNWTIENDLKIEKNGSNFCLIYYDGNATKIELYDVDTSEGFSLMSYLDFDVIGATDNQDVDFNYVSNNCITIYNGGRQTNNGCKIYEINSLMQFVLLREQSNVVTDGEDDYYYPDLDILIDDRIIHINKNKYHLLSYENGTIRNGWHAYPNAKVKKYSGSGLTGATRLIGFAKIGGSAGQTIRVYIPS